MAATRVPECAKDGRLRDIWILVDLVVKGGTFWTIFLAWDELHN